LSDADERLTIKGLAWWPVLFCFQRFRDITSGLTTFSGLPAA
jgi:hypothetical protein